MDFWAFWGMLGQFWVLGAVQSSSVQCCQYKKGVYWCPHMMLTKTLDEKNCFFWGIFGPCRCPGPRGHLVNIVNTSKCFVIFGTLYLWRDASLVNCNFWWGDNLVHCIFGMVILWWRTASLAWCFFVASLVHYIFAGMRLWYCESLVWWMLGMLHLWCASSLVSCIMVWCIYAAIHLWRGASLVSCILVAIFLWCTASLVCCIIGGLFLG